MTTKKISTFSSHLLQIVAFITCMVVLYSAYQNYKDDQRGEAIYQKIKGNLLTEIDIIYQNQVYFETSQWRRFYRKLEDSLNYPKYKLSKEEFQNIISRSPFAETDFYFKTDIWEQAKTHPEFMKRLTPYQLNRLHEFYTYSQVTASHYNYINSVLQTSLNNKFAPSMIEDEYKQYGTFINQAFLLDIKRRNILMYAEGIYYSAFDLPLPEHFRELNVKFNESAYKEKDAKS